MRDWLGYWGLRAEAHHLLGEYEQELAAAGKMREKQPADFGGRFYQFRALVGLGDLTAALVAAREAIDVEDSPLAHRFVDELRLHRYDPAADTLAKLAAGWLGARLSQRTPELLPTAKWHLSFLLREAGQLTEAQSLLEELASSDSVPGRRFWYLALLGQVLALRGDSIAVGRVLVSMDSIAPRAEDSGAQVIVRAELYARLGHFDIAQRLLQTFIARSQNYGAIAHTLPTDLAVLFRDYAPFQKLAQPRG
jgi:tetratricopeptide (TPR) repeat protein